MNRHSVQGRSQTDQWQWFLTDNRQQMPVLFLQSTHRSSCWLLKQQSKDERLFKSSNNQLHILSCLLISYTVAWKGFSNMSFVNSFPPNLIEKPMGFRNGPHKLHINTTLTVVNIWIIKKKMIQSISSQARCQNFMCCKWPPGQEFETTEIKHQQSNIFNEIP